MKISKQNRKTMYADALEARLKSITIETLHLRRVMTIEFQKRLADLDMRVAA